MKKIGAILAVVGLFVLFLLIRAYEDVLFYDPLLSYFKGDYKRLPLPEMDLLKVELNIAYRFLLNTAISLGVLWFVFRDSEIIKLSIVLYTVLFVALIIAFNVVVFTSEPGQSQLPLFYIRRFLIQPVFLLILLAGYYFQKKKL